mmetsp:Transcript_19390/g.31987  ORF Transcript_19390/g.31987 Transcript_19390/m.31987 type:complete len:159 (-) Transcript_19390:438-914(-)
MGLAWGSSVSALLVLLAMIVCSHSPARRIAAATAFALRVARVRVKMAGQAQIAPRSCPAPMQGPPARNAADMVVVSLMALATASQVMQVWTAWKDMQCALRIVLGMAPAAQHLSACATQAGQGRGAAYHCRCYRCRMKACARERMSASCCGALALASA